MSEKTNNFFNKIKVKTWLIPAIMIIIGALFVFVPGTSLSLICKAIGIAAIVLGIVCLVYYFGSGMKFNSKVLIFGIIAIGLGIYIFLNYAAFTSLLITILAIFIIVDGIQKLQTALDAYRLNIKGWGVPLAIAIVTIAVGVVMLLDPFESTKTLLVFIGIALIYQGIVDIVNDQVFINKVKRTEHNYKEIKEQRKEDKKRRQQEAKERKEQEEQLRKEQEAKEKQED